MALDPATLPKDIASLTALLLAADARADKAEAHSLGLDAQIADLKLTIAKMKRAEHSTSSERGARLLDRLEMQLGELVAAASEGKVAVEIASPAAGAAQAESQATTEKPARRPLDEKLPRERIVHIPPCKCAHCGSDRLRKIGEITTETLELVPAAWKVLSHVREKFTCRACEKITETLSPSHPIARGRAGPQLLAEILHNKYRAHLPLNRQIDIYAAQGIDLDVSTLADWVGACAATLEPLVKEIEKHVLAAERIHADDTTVPVLAKGKCTTGRLWAYVRDDAPFGGPSAPAALYYYSPTRGGEHPERHLVSYSGLMQADAYSGYNTLYAWPRRHSSGAPAAGAGRIVEAACWAHGRRKFFELAELQKAPVAKAIDYSLKRGDAFTRFLDDGRICMSNNAAERAVRGIAVGRKNWTFCGSDSGGRRAAAIYTLIETCKLNGVDPRAWLADVLARIADHPAKKIAELLPWNWKASFCAVKLAGHDGTLAQHAHCAPQNHAR